MNKLKRFYNEYLKQADFFLLGMCVTATLFGMMLIASTVNYSGNTKYLVVQGASLILGVFIYFILSMIDVDIIADQWWPLFFLSAGFIASLLIFGEGGDSTGNRAWIRFAGIGIQPAEIVKISYTIMLARLVVNMKRRYGIGHIVSLIAMVAFFGVFFGLIVIISADLGSALVYMFIFIFMLFLAGLQIYWFLIAIGAVVFIFPFLWNNFLTERYRQRILVPYVPSVDPTGRDLAWQMNQSKRAIANGGISGMGLFNGTETQSGRVPQQHTDFIFSVAGEELGILGCLLVVLILTIIIVRVMWVGIKSNSDIGMMVCCGMAAMLIFQTLENLGMCLGLTPVIGLTLPFFSYGGSSIVTMFAAMGIVSGVKMRPQTSRSMFRTAGR